MRVVNNGTNVQVTASFGEMATIVEGLRVAMVSYHNDRRAITLTQIIHELLNKQEVIR